MLKLLYGTWLLYWLLLLVSPVEVIYPSADAAFAIQLGFLVCVTLGYMAVVVASGGEPLPSPQAGEIAHARSIAQAAIVLSIVGFLCLLYDKVAIQGIDYSRGLAFAREQWRVLGEQRNSVSSIFSLVGYLTGSAYFVAVVVATSQFHLFGRRALAVLLAIGVALALLNSVITGGRSNLLLMVAFVIVAGVLRRGSSVLRVFRSASMTTGVVVLASAVATYVLFVTFARAQAQGIPTDVYVNQFFPFLGLKVNESYLDGLDGSVVQSIEMALFLAVGYLVHSFSWVAAMVQEPGGDGTILFSHVLRLMARLHLIAPPNEAWFLSGRFPSLPGALWYQTGLPGLLVGGLSLGAIGGALRTWTIARSSRLLPLALYAAFGVILLLSPLCFAVDVLAFPFIILGIVLLGFWQSWRDAVARRPRVDAPSNAPHPPRRLTGRRPRDHHAD